MNRPTMSKKGKKVIREMMKKMEKPMKESIARAKKDGDEYMFYLGSLSVAKGEIYKQRGELDAGRSRMTDNLVLALLVHHGASYPEVLRVAQKFEDVVGFMAAMEMINQSTE